MEKLPPLPATAPSSRRNKDLKGNSKVNSTARRMQKLIDESKASNLLELSQSYICNSHAIPKDQEGLELSSQLKALRKDYDISKSLADRSEQIIAVLTSEKQQLEQMSMKNLLKFQSTNSRVESLQTNTSDTLSRQKEEEKGTEIYLNMLNRMRTTKVHMLARANSLKEQLKELNLTLEDAQRRGEKSKVEAGKARLAYLQLKGSAEQQVSVCKKDIKRIESDITSVEKAKLRKT